MVCKPFPIQKSWSSHFFFFFFGFYRVLTHMLSFVTVLLACGPSAAKTVVRDSASMLSFWINIHIYIYIKVESQSKIFIPGVRVLVCCHVFVCPQSKLSVCPWGCFHFRQLNKFVNFLAAVQTRLTVPSFFFWFYWIGLDWLIFILAIYTNKGNRIKKCILKMTLFFTKHKPACTVLLPLEPFQFTHVNSW